MQTWNNNYDKYAFNNIFVNLPTLDNWKCQLGIFNNKKIKIFSIPPKD